LSIKFVAPVLAWLALAVSIPVAAQQTSPADPSGAAPAQAAPQSSTAPAQQPPAPQSSTEKDKGKDHPDSSSQGKVAGTSNDRLFFALPNFLSLENAGNIPPLTSGQKFSVVARSAFDKVQFVWYGFLSGLSQAENSEPGYGQGAEGYGKRYGAAFADGTIENFMVGAAMPSLFRQDPRFFQLGHGGFLHRTEYAVSRSFVTRSDSGHKQFNFSEIIGGMLAASISTYSYHPRSSLQVRYNAAGMPNYTYIPSDRTLANTTKVWGTQLGYDTLTLVVKEFWPDIHRKISHKAK